MRSEHQKGDTRQDDDLQEVRERRSARVRGTGAGGRRFRYALNAKAAVAVTNALWRHA
jgi:hypothetical protein